MVYRNEIKHVITQADKLAICANMRAVATLDSHAVQNGRYRIRSLYFDNPANMALREKMDGVSEREKFRLRYYDNNTGLIHLEKKVKKSGMGYKLSETVTAEEAQRIIDGDTAWMATSGRALLIELYSKMHSQGLRPRTIVDYVRTPFVYKPGNVRVTIDEDIRTGLNRTDFLNPDCPMIPAGDSVIILEVKWDEFLPDIIRKAVAVSNVRATAFSKYHMSRIYG